MWAYGIGTMKTEKILLKIFVRNSTKKKIVYTKCVTMMRNRYPMWLGKKTVKSQPGNEDLSWGIFMLFGVKEKNGFCPQKAYYDVPCFFSLAY